MIGRKRSRTVPVDISAQQWQDYADNGFLHLGGCSTRTRSRRCATAPTTSRWAGRQRRADAARHGRRLRRAARGGRRVRAGHAALPQDPGARDGRRCSSSCVRHPLFLEVCGADVRPARAGLDVSRDGDEQAGRQGPCCPGTRTAATSGRSTASRWSRSGWRSTPATTANGCMEVVAGQPPAGLLTADGSTLSDEDAAALPADRGQRSRCRRAMRCCCTTG